MELNCPICKTPMKAYHGLFEKDMYCANPDCGKPSTRVANYTERQVKVTINGQEVSNVTDQVDSNEIEDLTKAIHDALQKAFYDYLSGTTPQTATGDDLDKIAKLSLEE
jgi:hypothetical protein